MDKPMTFNEWMGKQGNLALVHANCCRIAYEAGQQSQQAKVEELQTLYTQQGINMLKLQKRVDAIKQLIHDYHQHSYREADDFVFYLEQVLKGEG
ncbi:hypothetical protein [Acinetobacter baumannii]|uniref:hypothetical protein n=1 Tax=Acinetobacter baumannii TaxID=470 RepID=UPI001FF499DA|nr:hypothetical protein [Acinetobacter baumannii]MCJ9255927.1 hypothetical protein [Acinetobacter baumannii]